MIITATQKNIRQAPRKVREVADAVRKLDLNKAIEQLAVMERRSSLVVLKTIRQAIANATNNLGFKITDIKLKNITVDEGQIYKRWRAVSRGRAHSIEKKTSHIKVELEAIKSEN